MDPLVVANVVGNALLTLVAGATALIVARSARGRAANVALASYASLVAANALTSVVISVPHPWWSLNGWVWNYVSFFLLVGAYLVFVGRALETPLARPLASRAGLLAVLALFGALGGSTFVFYEEWFRPQGDGTYLPDPASSTLRDITFLLIPVAFVYGLIAAVDALRRSPRGTVRRERAKAYLLAFGVQDAGLALSFLAFQMTSDAARWIFLEQTLVAIASMLLLGRALLKYQLFDFELKVKVGVRRGTVVTVFLGAFLVVTAIAEQFLQAYGIVVGGVAVGLLLLASRPIERAAERLADTAMPRVQATSTYVAFKKLEVYRAAVESALEGGAIDERERGTLDRLRAKLGIAPEDAALAEADARERLGPVALAA